MENLRNNLNFVIFPFIFIVVIAKFSNCQNLNALLRGNTRESNHFEKFNSTEIQNAAVTFLQILVNETSPTELLDVDYEGLEMETNKTKRSKAALKWLKEAIGIRSGDPTVSANEAEMAEATTATAMGMMSKFDPLGIKRRISSKVSSVSSAIGGVVGIGRGGGGMDSASNDDNSNSGGEVDDGSMRADNPDEDESSSVRVTLLPSLIIGVAFTHFAVSCVV